MAAAHFAGGWRRNGRSIHCRECDREIYPAGALRRDDRQVYWLACLVNHPEATFGERRRARRLASGLICPALEERAGLTARIGADLRAGQVRGSPEAAGPAVRRPGVKAPEGK